MDSNNEKALTTRSSAELGCVPDGWPQQRITIRDEFQSLVEHMTSVRVRKASYVLHHEESWFDFRDETEKMAKKLTSGIIYIAAANIAETLAGRPAEYAVDCSGRSLDKRGTFEQCDVL